MEEIVSIIVPVYNVCNFIEDTIHSVLAQTYKKWELLLVDDGSIDGTLDKIRPFLVDDRIKLIASNQNDGAAAARNKGLDHAIGRYIAFLDSDDLWDVRKLEWELEFMEKHQAGFVFTGYEFADENGVGTGKIVRVPETLNLKQAYGNTTIFTSTVLLDTSKISKELIRMPRIKSEDTATWWNILKTGELAYGLDENLVKYRRSGKSLSSNKLEALRRIWRLYRQIGKLSVIKSLGYFIIWAWHAVSRRV